MIAWVLICLTATAGEQFEVRLTDGSELAGRILSWTSDDVELELDSDRRRLPLEQISQIEQSVPASAAQPADYTIRFLNDDSLRAYEVQGDVESLEFGWAGHDASKLPIRAVRSIRLRAPTKALNEEWAQMLAAEYEGDALVIRRSATALDYLEGVIIDFDTTQVIFRYNGEEIPVKKEKLEGMIFFRPQTAKSSKPAIRLQFGSEQIGATAVRMPAQTSAAEVQVLLSDDFSFLAKLSKLSRVDFDTGRIVYLSEIKPTDVVVTPAISSTPVPEGLRRLIYQPRMNVDFEGRPLQLFWPTREDLQTYAKGIAAHSRTEMSFRLDGEFATLRGTVGLDPSCTPDANVHVIVTVDGQQAELLHLQRENPPMDLDVALDGARQLQITIDYGDGVDLGDRVHLCNLRAVK